MSCSDNQRTLSETKHSWCFRRHEWPNRYLQVFAVPDWYCSVWINRYHSSQWVWAWCQSGTAQFAERVYALQVWMKSSVTTSSGLCQLHTGRLLQQHNEQCSPLFAHWLYTTLLTFANFREKSEWFKLTLSNGFSASPLKKCLNSEFLSRRNTLCSATGHHHQKHVVCIRLHGSSIN